MAQDLAIRFSIGLFKTCLAYTGLACLVHKIDGVLSWDGKRCRRLGLLGFVEKPTCVAKKAPRLVSEHGRCQ